MVSPAEPCGSGPKPRSPAAASKPPTSPPAPPAGMVRQRHTSWRRCCAIGACPPATSSRSRRAPTPCHRLVPALACWRDGRARSESRRAATTCCAAGCCCGDSALQRRRARRRRCRGAGGPVGIGGRGRRWPCRWIWSVASIPGRGRHPARDTDLSARVLPGRALPRSLPGPLRRRHRAPWRPLGHPLRSHPPRPPCRHRRHRG